MEKKDLRTTNAHNINNINIINITKEEETSTSKTINNYKYEQNANNNQQTKNVSHPNNMALKKVLETIKFSIVNLQNKKDTNEIIKQLNNAFILLSKVITENNKLFADIKKKFNQLMIQNNNIKKSFNINNIDNIRNSLNNMNLFNSINASTDISGLIYNSKEYENGDRYEGYFKEDKKEGFGKYYYNNGNIYEGEFKNDIVEGKGIFNFNDGSKYVGLMKNGKAEGKGTFFWKNGNKYEGDWIDGKRTGQGVFFWKNGDIEIGNFDEDPIGQFAKLNTKGEIYLIKYTED